MINPNNTLEIIKRIGISNGVFAEFGVGDGKENNTLILLGLKWKGFWCGGENLAFNISNTSRLFFYKKWINQENICSLMKDGMQDLDEKNVDLISLDLDGNDLYFCCIIIIARISLIPSSFILLHEPSFIIRPTQYI